MPASICVHEVAGWVCFVHICYLVHNIMLGTQQPFSACLLNERMFANVSFLRIRLGWSMKTALQMQLEANISQEDMIKENTQSYCAGMGRAVWFHFHGDPWQGSSKLDLFLAGIWVQSLGDWGKWTISTAVTLPVHLCLITRSFSTLWQCQTYFHLLMVTVGFKPNLRFPSQFGCEGGLPLISVIL